MTEAHSTQKPSDTVHVIRGQYHEFMLIPIMDHHARFIPAGPLTFGVEGRALGNPGSGTASVRGASLHVFNADRSQEWLRFDCFDGEEHYHYILNDKGHNVVWGYDINANGPMIDWVIARVRTTLPAMLRQAGAEALASEVEAQGIDDAIVEQIHDAMLEEDARTLPGTPGLDDMMREGLDWMKRWKKLHPEFNTV